MNNYKIKEGYLYKDSFTEKDFLNSVINNIKNDNDAPSYIFNEMILSDVKRINVPLILTDGDAKIEYSRMIGINNIITTTKTTTKTYGNGYQNVSHNSYSNTVTNWQNDSGVIEGSSKSGYYYKEYIEYDDYIRDHIMDKNNIRALTIEELDKYSISLDVVEYMKKDILDKVYQENTTYPTNQVKDEKYNGDVILYNTTCTIVSLYSIDVTIRDKKIIFVASSNGDIDLKMFGEYPFDDYSKVFEFTKEISKERSIATKNQRLIKRLAILLSVPLFILLLVLGISLNILVLTIISFVVLILGIIIFIIKSKEIKKISKPYNKRIIEYRSRIYNDNNKNKEEGYNKFINKMNL